MRTALAAAREPTFIGTRRYVRRQRSWFRRDHRIIWLDGAGPGEQRRATRFGHGATYPDQVMFAKGHGTQNDFVLLPDLDGRLTLDPAAVAALCDRRRGIGADGVLRVTTAGAAADAGVFDRLPEGVGAGDWYMDYRNADGSIAQMCGNGVRVFAHYLRASGLETRDEFVVGSLAGPRPVVLNDFDATTADVTVEMGKTNQLGSGCGDRRRTPVHRTRGRRRQPAPGVRRPRL